MQDQCPWQEECFHPQKGNDANDNADTSTYAAANVACTGFSVVQTSHEDDEDTVPTSVEVLAEVFPFQLLLIHLWRLFLFRQPNELAPPSDTTSSPTEPTHKKQQQDDDEENMMNSFHPLGPHDPLLFYLLPRSSHLLCWISRRVDLAVVLIATSQRLQPLLTQNNTMNCHVRLDKRDLPLRGSNLQYLLPFCTVHLWPRLSFTPMLFMLFVELKFRLVILRL